MPRITTGLLKGFSVTTPRQIRPTGDKVHQAMFNILGERVIGARVLDAFAGSGALGLEALSRGAQTVVFLDSHPASVTALRRNLERIAPGMALGAWEMLPGDALVSLRTLARRRRIFDLIIADPPYDSDVGKKFLNAVAEYAMLAPAGLLCWEHAHRKQAPPNVGDLARDTQHRYGDTVLSFYRNSASQNFLTDS